MKKRTGLVSNSSSSYFCIVGISVDATGDENDFNLLKAIGFFPEDAKFEDTDGLDRYVSYGVQGVKDDFIVVGSDEPSWVGIDVEQLLRDNWTVSQLSDSLLIKLSDVGYKATSMPQFAFGEAGSG
jgi:hypothetical protein